MGFPSGFKINLLSSYFRSKMVWCQVIKANDQPCANYARKGLTCCYSHRKLESHSDSEPEKAQVVEKVVETFEVNPWDDDDV